MNPAQIPQPERLQRRPQHHGMPIPYTSLMLPDGTPDFRVTDYQAWVDVVTNRKCALCGESADLLLWFIGGAKCAEYRCFFDPAMHIDCALYAIEVCPFLACKSDYQPLATGKAAKAGLKLDVSGIAADTRPDQFFMYATTGYQVGAVGEDNVIHIPADAGFKVVPVPKERSAFTMTAWLASMRELDARLTESVRQQLQTQLDHA